MVIKKSEFTDKLQNLLEDKVGSFTHSLDTQLLEQGKVSFHVKDLSKSPWFIPTNHIAEFVAKVQQLYLQAGWKVNRHTGYDQRDGDSWDYVTIS